MYKQFSLRIFTAVLRTSAFWSSIPSKSLYPMETRIPIAFRFIEPLLLTVSRGCRPQRESRKVNRANQRDVAKRKEGGGNGGEICKSY